MGIIKTRKIVQGAMVAGIYGALSLINTYTGNLFDIFIGYAMVIGLVWYGNQYDLKDSALCALAALIVVAMVGTPYFTIIAFTSCLSGVAVGEMVKRKAKLLSIMIVVSIICFLNNILVYEVFSGLLGINLIEEFTMGYNMMLEYVPNMQELFPIDALVSLIPTALVLMSLLEMYVIILFISLASRKLKFPFPKYVHIVNLKISRKWGYIIAVGMFVGYGLTFVKGIDPDIGMYIYFISNLAYIVQGVSTISFISIVYKQRWLMIVGILTAFIGGFNQIHTILGMIDIFSDLRKNLLYNRQ